MNWLKSNNQDPYQRWDRHNHVVPFAKYEDEYHLHSGYMKRAEWYHVQPFTAELTIVDAGNGNGNAYFKLRDDDNFVYRISLNDFIEILKTKDIRNGRIEFVNWTFKKVGGAYLLTPA